MYKDNDVHKDNPTLEKKKVFELIIYLASICSDGGS